MHKKLFTLLFVIFLTAGLLAGCTGGSNNPSATPATSGVSEQTQDATNAATTESPAAEVSAQKETVTLNVLMCQWWESVEDTMAKYGDKEGKEMFDALEERLGVRFNFIEADAEQQQVYFVSGDLGDLCMIFEVEDIHNLMESDLLTPLNDLVDRYGENIKTSTAEGWTTALNILGDGVNAYGLPISIGNEGTYEQNGRYIYTLRYDHWEELGFPEWTNYYEYLDDIAKLLEAHPTNDEGLASIGVTIHNDSTTNTSTFENLMYGTVGFGEAGGNGSMQINIADGSLVNNYVDEFSPFWLAVDYYRYAYKLGILDPDWAVQTSQEMNEKYDAGRLISADGYFRGSKYVEKKLAENPQYLGGIINVPVKGAMFFQNAQQLAGWEVCFWTIPTSSRYPEKTMELLNFTYGFEGGRFMRHGNEGMFWEYDSENVPVLNERYRNIKFEDGERYIFDMLGMLCGPSGAAITPDGSPLDLRFSPSYYASNVSDPWLLAFIDHYGISWPNEIFVNHAETGYMFDRMRYDQRIMMYLSPYENEMSRIDALCVSSAIAYMAKLVHADSDEEFNNLKDQFLAELNGYGINRLYEYVKERYETVRKDLNVDAYMATFPAIQR